MTMTKKNDDKYNLPTTWQVLAVGLSVVIINYILKHVFGI